MLSFSGSLKVFVAVEPCDMRKGFNGLYAAVTERLGEDPKGGALFVFCNRRRTRIKILYWDGTGLWVPYRSFDVKPGETIRYEFPRAFGAYWVRARSDSNTTATVIFEYR